ncbi:hypothetical protein OG897_40090 [Streptomyces sp. NBC_00237]|uniref:hypothetical protein n=1 Tax=Streptomyces sp. NBC_00237 TaxID=2975687 RepID=UPI002251A580|nr:hypothetical protein [Streptomyces sp. NBC_00237]MCX5207593.1 hypothetical protein [Streptomyces sp. NBC_00237]
MAVSISFVLLLAIVVVVLIRGGSVRLLHALACAAFGFFLASSGAGPYITRAMSGITGWISSF